MRKSILAGVAVVPLFLLFIHGPSLQAANGPDVQATYDDDYGLILTDADGHSIYLYTEDSEGESRCRDGCTRNWPPLLVEGEPTGGDDVNPDLLGTIERPDGSTQVTYNGRPVYRYARDTQPGHTRGQKLGGVFFLVSPAGESVTEQLVREIAVEDDVLASLMSEGGQLFANNCAVCHGGEGQGGVGPRLAGNTGIQNFEFIVKMVLNGFPEHGMPAWRDRLSDKEIAAVITFVRNSWSNDFGPVTEEVVKDLK